MFNYSKENPKHHTFENSSFEFHTFPIYIWLLLSLNVLPVALGLQTKPKALNELTLMLVVANFANAK